MKILFVHQNFPAQFKFLAPALVDQGYRVYAMTAQRRFQRNLVGIKIFNYTVSRATSTSTHPWISDFETKVIRADACFRLAMEMKNQGIDPDIIVAHPGWGESLFLKEVWPGAKLGIYCEFFYQSSGADVGFDSEFAVEDEGDSCRLKLKNVNNLLHLECADLAMSPTRWQANTFPANYRKKICVIHDGIDSENIVPDPNVKIVLNGKIVLTRDDQIVTFVNRNLEPYRGYHIFMRALPEILKRHPSANILIVGGEGTSYGPPPNGMKGWKEIFFSELRKKVTTDQLAKIHFLGLLPKKELISIFQISSVHVYLTYPFVLSWSLLEAMSTSCAIVASETPPVSEVIQDGVNGLLFDFFSNQDLADCVCRLLVDKTIRYELGRAARETIVSRYDLRKICLPAQVDWIKRLSAMDSSSPVG